MAQLNPSAVIVIPTYVVEGDTIHISTQTVNLEFESEVARDEWLSALVHGGSNVPDDLRSASYLVEDGDDLNPTAVAQVRRGLAEAQEDLAQDRIDDKTVRDAHRSLAEKLRREDATFLSNKH